MLFPDMNFESRERREGMFTLVTIINSWWKVEFKDVVVVYNVTIVAIGHGFLKKFWPFGNRLRSIHCREFLYVKLYRPAYFLRTTQLLPHPGHE